MFVVLGFGVSPIVLIILGVVLIVSAHLTAGAVVAMLAILVGGVVASMALMYAIARLNRLQAPPRHQMSRLEAAMIENERGVPNWAQDHALPRYYDERSVATVYGQPLTQLEPTTNGYARSASLRATDRRSHGVWEYRSHLDGLTREERIEAAARYLATKYGSDESSEPSGSSGASSSHDDDQR